MLLVYASRQGKTEALVNALNVPSTLKLADGSETVNEPYVLVTYSDKVGEVPAIVEKFLSTNHRLLKAIIATGSIERHYETFGYAGLKISQEYHVPLLAIVNGRGSDADEIKIKEMLTTLETKLSQ
ncbi:class Ib ribonucleoside-diphosphate reductase assembly flavoprotein NrdI [Bulleidia sp. zg-1006]|uniref:class Ib ribonucleoside-diphosphate reductase assembly flavoprotein NrdI n=1 Tax=Bulleidia sp. zg-1006 TaxID=2806552 RepID=UPI0019397DD7|nr:class Ib ribonucleoside-diphosphate reductase assembly flavoprotein NrdI [Bulleidia sp. zg-1006]QRG87267.1 class Ib ribonucleoside-diphosphate reductase assembly flavoprotein NrdI [Bulleidia sp. zg-1006]